MDRESLERLLTDRSLGALPADTVSLLEAYLRRDSAAAALGREIEDTVGFARKALTEERVSSMPAFPIDGLRQIERWRRRARWTGYISGLAACLAIGVGIGTMRSVGERESVVQAPTVQSRIIQAHASADDKNAVNGGIWSAEHWRQRAADQKPADKGVIIWDSPLSPPRKGDAT